MGVLSVNLPSLKIDLCLFFFFNGGVDGSPRGQQCSVLSHLCLNSS